MKRLLQTLLAAAVAAALFAPATSGDASLLFDDVPQGHPHQTAIEWLSHADITRGCNPPTNDRFCPEERVTRGQMASFLSRALTLTDSGGGGIFVDVASTAHKLDISKIATAGIAKGCNPPINDHYCPNEYVTRGQMASFLSRALTLTDSSGGGTFADIANSAHKLDISKIATAGITRGCNPPINDHYCPNEYVTRGQMASFLYRALGPDLPETDNRYWDWGWGIYNPKLSAEIKADFDWSTINFGNIPLNDETLSHLNRILDLNPNHKFLVRLWPIALLGEDTGNRSATLLHYLYRPGVRQAVLEEVTRQVEFVIGGVDKPESIVGFTFLEELPQHFTSDRQTLEWRRGEPMPWDIALFADDIAADLGEPFDMAIEAHRLWWGGKLTEVISEIHEEVKRASNGKDIYFWQAALFRTLDMLEPGESIVQGDVVPIHYRELLNSGLVDGIFGYPNTPDLWQERTIDIADAFDVPFWSQSSTPGVMRGSTWDETMVMARLTHPQNLGTMFFVAPSTGAGDSNPMPYEDGTTMWSIEDHARKLAELIVNY